MIGGDGAVYEGRGWAKEGAHTRGYNTAGVGICLMGDFSFVAPSATMLKTAQDLIDCAERQVKYLFTYIIACL